MIYYCRNSNKNLYLNKCSSKQIKCFKKPKLNKNFNNLLTISEVKKFINHNNKIIGNKNLVYKLFYIYNSKKAQKIN